MNKRTFILAHAEARQRAIECVRQAPDGYVIEVKEARRSTAQNDAVHALLGELGDLLHWKFNGQLVDLDDLKTIFMAAYRKATNQSVRFCIGLDGQPVVMNWRTRDLSKQEASEFYEYISAWAAKT